MAGVGGPAGGVGVELAVADRWVGAGREEEVDERAVAAEGRFVEGGGAARRRR